MRPLPELTDVPDPAWPALSDRLAAAAVPLRVLEPDPEGARTCLLQLQVTARSWLGALILNCGGLLLDDGWLRVYGGGGPGLPGLGRVNAFDEGRDPAEGLVVAHDVLGGVFALNGIDPAAAGRPGQPGEVIYFAPDALRWEPLDVGHGDWLAWLLEGPLDDFYGTLRWPGWREEIAALPPTEGITVYPFLWSAEAQQNLPKTTRRPVPMRELLSLSGHCCATLGECDPGFLGAF
ncbi:DUF2625 family protein [Actinomadura kijaniata]|uniref:DUF2625 family protein n=1 Tax=Actinomadura kijaniata TaxID=46161 RepID=UPI000831590A|nr:DUF2625 family protein [Actinomadura kijaniata]